MYSKLKLSRYVFNSTHLFVYFQTTKSFLPGMIERNHGHIVTIASSAGLFGVCTLADYCASKFAAVGFDESLRHELFVSHLVLETLQYLKKLMLFQYSGVL